MAQRGVCGCPTAAEPLSDSGGLGRDEACDRLDLAVRPTYGRGAGVRGVDALTASYGAQDERRNQACPPVGTTSVPKQRGLDVRCKLAAFFRRHRMKKPQQSAAVGGSYSLLNAPPCCFADGCAGFFRCVTAVIFFKHFLERLQQIRRGGDQSGVG